MPNNSHLTKFYCLFPLFVISLAIMSPVTWAVTVEVCPLGCAYDSPVTAVNDETRDDGDIINVHFGTYVINGTLQVDKQLTILGNDSIFDANGIRVINVFFATGNLTINDLTIRNGQPTSGFGGGAVSVWGGATLTVTGGIFENNQAEFGGAIHNDGSTVTLSESVFSGNRATAGEGGAIWTNGGGTTELTRVEVDGNMASVGGGGLAVGGDGSHLEIIASTISGNAELLPIQTASNPVVSGTSVYCGTVAHGQFFVADALALSAFEFEIRLNGPVDDPNVIPISLSIPGQVRSGSIFGPIIATAQAVAPGGVWLGGSTQTLAFNLDKVLALNPGATYVIEMFPDTDYFTMLVSTDDFGGGDRYCGGLITEGSDWAFRTFGGTPGDNAGIYAQANSTVRLDTSTLSGNLGDGIVVEDSTLESIFSTIAWNYGNGFTSIGTLAGGTFSSTLFSGNGGNDCDSSNFTSLGYNLIEEDTGCSITPAIGDQIGDSANPINAVLAPLSNNGGFTSTHAFGPDTPAVDGAGTGCSGNLDQRGVSRPKGLACDIGAFESIPLLQRMIDTTPPGDVLIVPDGIYQELIIIGDNKGLRGSGPDNVVIDASAISIPGSVITATGDFSLEGISVTGGSSPGNGGAINTNADGIDIVLRNVVFDNNDAVSSGGAIYIQNGTIDGTNVTFTNNSADEGGAIHNVGSWVDFRESEFSRNIANVGNGSAILTDNGGSTLLWQATVDNNLSRLDGGPLVVIGDYSELIWSQLNLVRSTVSNNYSPVSLISGVLLLDGGDLHMHTSTVSGNSGFGIQVDPDSVVQAYFSTITNNFDGFYALSGSHIEFEDSIIAGNGPPGAPDSDCLGSFISLGYNLIGDNAECVFTPATGDLIGTTEEPIDPLLGPLQDNGGTTLTHLIEPNSPAVNAGGSACIEDLDQRGVDRPIGSACDIGAYEADAVPLQLGPVVLGVTSLGQHQSPDHSYPGVIDVPIIEIPIEKLTGDTFSAPESAPLGSFPLGSFPIGSFDLRNAPMGLFPLGSFPIGSFPLGSFPLGSFPLGSFPLSSIPLQSAGGWTEILNTTPELADLAGAPLQTVTLEQLLRVSPLPDSVASIALRDLSIQGSPLASLSLPGLSLGNTTVEKLDEWVQNADPGADKVCATLLAEGPLLTGCTDEDTLLGLEMEGAPVSALSLASLPLGSFQVGSLPIGSFPLGSFPIGSFPLGSFPLGSFPIGSFPIGSFPIGSFPLGSFSLGSFPLGSFNLLAAPLGSFPLGSFPIGSFPLGSFSIDGKSFCKFYDEQALASGDSTCAGLGITNPGTDNLADLIEALRIENPSGNIGSTPLGSFPLGSFPIGSFPIGSFDLATLSTPPISELTLAGIDGCTVIENNSSDTCTSLGLSNSSTLADAANAYGGSLAASPLGSFPIGSFDVAGLPMGSFPLGSFDVNGAPLGSFPLGSFDLITSPLGSFPIGSFSDGSCAECLTLADAARAVVIDGDATLADLKTAEPIKFAALTLGDVLDAMTLSTLYCPPDPDPDSGPEVDCAETLGEIEDTGNLTLGQLLIAMMLKTDFPWETISLEQLDAQEFSADHFVTYTVDIPLTGTESELISIAVTMDDSFMYVEGSASLQTVLESAGQAGLIDDPMIVTNEDDTQTLVFNQVLGGFSSNTISFEAVPALALGDYLATATVQLGTDTPVLADNTSSSMTVVPHGSTDADSPDGLPTSPTDVLLLGFIDTPDDIDYFKVAAPAAGDRVAVFMSNPVGDNDLIMYEPLSTVEAKGQTAESPALDSVPFEDDGVNYGRNLTEEPNALEDVNLATAPLASISTNRGDIDESVSAIAGDTAPFTIQVSGYNGATSVQPYTLRVKVTPEVPVPQCTARSWPGSAVSTVARAGSWLSTTNAVFLVNGDRLASSDPGGATDADDALTAINSLINAPGITDGVVVDVSADIGVDYTDWDTNPCDADAANEIVNAITEYLEVMRGISPNLAYVTIVGSDEVIPFARKPDETSIANESTFAGEFSDNAMYGALVTRHFLSDDTYGDIDPIAWLDRYLNVPELGVGRLVESAEDIQAAAENYVLSGGVLDPQTALSAGYDFVADAALEIDDTFNLYGPALGFDVETALIDPPGITPDTRAWSKSDFLRASGISGNNPVDLVSFNMHFDFDEALPSIGDATGNYTDNLINTADLAGSDLTGGIWFTVGCHSGSSVADVSVVGAPSEDWAQTFGRQGALYLAQNAYGLGDTEAVALTERLMANFARNLNGSLSIGQAHVFAKQQYFADLGLYGEYDYKALQAATLFGLPMYQFGNGAMVVDTLPPVLPVTTDPLSGLTSASWSVTDTGITQTTTDSKGELFSVDGEVQFVHFRPLQPIVRRDVTGPNSEIAGGAFLTGLVTEDISVMDMAFARPVIDLGENEPEVEWDEGVFPTAFTNTVSFKAPPTPLTPGPFESRQQLNVIVGQFTSPLDGSSSGTERLFRNFATQVFYRPTLPTPLAIASGTDDFIRPEFDNIQASLVGPSGAQQAAFSVDVFDEGTVLRVAVLYLQSVTAGEGNWVLADLVQGAGNTWTGGGPVDLSGISNGQIDYMVQAVDDNGNVANSTFKGLFYVAETIPGPPDGEDPDDPFEVVLTNPDLNPPGELGNDGWHPVESVQVDVTTDGEVTYEYSVDGSRPLLALTPDGFIVSGDGIHIVEVFGSDGSYVTFVVLIDNKEPEIVISTPADGSYVVQGLAPPADYDCRDSGSGTASCIGDVANGVTVPDDETGVQTFSVSATDHALLESRLTNSYVVVDQLDIDGPDEPVLIDTVIGITATATDDLGDDIQYAIVEWGDGTTSEAPDDVLRDGSTFTAVHEYMNPGVYQITVSINDGGAYVQTGVFEYAVVYDPMGGFVTGGGWFDSPVGAYTSDPALTGKAHFGFISKYKKGQSVPEGSTNFRFNAGSLEFDATAYDWMIIAGARARYKGVGTINDGSELYKFMVTALDADISGLGITEDGFRIKIWQEDSSGAEIVLYDNGLGVDDSTGSGGTTALGGGSITVHAVKKK